MTNKVNAGLLMYRYGREGLEIFLVKPNIAKDDDNWEIPNGYVDGEENSLSVAKREFEVETGIELIEQELIPLDDIKNSSSEVIRAWAFEDESEEEHFKLPLQSILGKNESPLKLRRKHKYLMEKGCYFVMKEAVKKVFPEQVAQIKELQEILSVRNMIKNI